MSASQRPGLLIANAGFVALGGAVGTLARFLLDGFIGDSAVGGVSGVPLGIFTINVVGAFLLGLLLEGLGPSERWRRTRLLLGTGALGGFTTYSSLAVGTSVLAGGPSSASIVVAAGYALATLVVGGLASWCGIVTGSRISASHDRRARPTRARLTPSQPEGVQAETEQGGAAHE